MRLPEDGSDYHFKVPRFELRKLNTHHTPHYVSAGGAERRVSSVSTTNRSGIVCFRCGTVGHYKAECMHWKTKMCWNVGSGPCTIPSCSFAHDESELRFPWKPHCIRILKKDGVLIKAGCGSREHTFRQCTQSRETPLLLGVSETQMCLPCGGEEDGVGEEDVVVSSKKRPVWSPPPFERRRIVSPKYSFPHTRFEEGRGWRSL